LRVDEKASATDVGAFQRAFFFPVFAREVV
jgi:hypothetical protein